MIPADPPTDRPSQLAVEIALSGRFDLVNRQRLREQLRRHLETMSPAGTNKRANTNSIETIQRTEREREKVRLQWELQAKDLDEAFGDLPRKTWTELTKLKDCLWPEAQKHLEEARQVRKDISSKPWVPKDIQNALQRWEAANRHRSHESTPEADAVITLGTPAPASNKRAGQDDGNPRPGKRRQPDTRVDEADIKDALGLLQDLVPRVQLLEPDSLQRLPAEKDVLVPTCSDQHWLAVWSPCGSTRIHVYDSLPTRERGEEMESRFETCSRDGRHEPCRVLYTAPLAGKQGDGCGVAMCAVFYMLVCGVPVEPPFVADVWEVIFAELKRGTSDGEAPADGADAASLREPSVSTPNPTPWEDLLGGFQVRFEATTSEAVPLTSVLEKVRRLLRPLHDSSRKLRDVIDSLVVAEETFGRLDELGEKRMDAGTGDQDGRGMRALRRVQRMHGLIGHWLSEARNLEEKISEILAVGR